MISVIFSNAQFSNETGTFIDLIYHNFAKIIMKAGYASPIRTPRGRDVMAACGQLRSLSVKLKKYDRKLK